MQPRPKSVKFLDLVLVAFVVAVFLFASPFYLVWMTPETPWYVPYLIWLCVIGASEPHRRSERLIWLCVIVVTGIVQQLRDRHEL